jgi:hypothetical protein
MRHFASLLIFLIYEVQAVESAEPLRRIDPSEPFQIRLGRGSGWHGLNTVAITNDGTTSLFRHKLERRRGADRGYTETLTLILPASELTKLLSDLDDSEVLKLEREYHDANIHDGRQWVFLVQQGERETSVYCDNKFPRAITRFAEALDALLEANVPRDARWKRVTPAAGRDEAELWDSIRQ